MRFRFKIRTLLIVTAVLALPMGYCGMTLQEHRAEEAALRQLEKDGWWGSPHKSDISKEDSSVRARATRVLNMPFQYVFGTAFSERCTHLDLTAGKSTNSLQALESLQYLRHITLEEEDLDCDRFVDTFLKLERLESIEFLIDNISVDSCKQLTDAGIEVRHYGLKGYQPEQDFLRYADHCHPIDLDRSHLNVRLVKGDEGPRFSIAIETFDPFPIYQMPSPSLQYTIEQVIPGTIAELTASGELVETNTKDIQGSNFYDGIHQGITYHSLQLISHKETGLRMKWVFKTSYGQFGEVDVELPINIVTVDVDVDVAAAVALQDATNLFGRHFELVGFHEPVFDKKKNWFIFKAK